jgi:hypothetical protein
MGVLMGATELANELKDFGEGGAGLECAVGCQLVDHTIGERVGEWNAEFDDIGAGVCEASDDLE